MPQGLGKSHFDIREYKKELRQKYRKLRGEIPKAKKNQKDAKIFGTIVGMHQYLRCSVVLVFVSMDEEIDTHKFISQCVANGKKVAVPYCISGGRDMDFYFINSVDELTKRTFGVLEPNPEIHEKAVDFSDSICIIPGLSFDHSGYRIGYGGGFYDRFLSSKFNGITRIGVCYQQALRAKIIRGRYDVSCNFVVTEQGIRDCKPKNSRFNKKRYK